MSKQQNLQIKKVDISTTGWSDYELLDSGNYQKLERFGNQLIIRSEPTAIWKPVLSSSVWDKAAARFHIDKGANQGTWEKNLDTNQNWMINFKGLKINIFISGSRHVGIFPEQHLHWDWINQKIEKSGHPISLLNLFGYTGVSSLCALKAGANVTHVDASKNSIGWAKKSLSDSGLSPSSVRWIVDDAGKFIQREIRRERRYDAIIMDPPKFGHGPKGEIWKFDQAIQALLASGKQILSNHPLFFIVTAYNVNASAFNLGGWLAQAMDSFSGKIEYGNLIQVEKSAGRKIHQSIYAKWEGKD